MDDQRSETYQAWAELARHPRWVQVMDDMQQIISTFPAEMQPGGWRLYGAIQWRTPPPLMTTKDRKEMLRLAKQRYYEGHLSPELAAELERYKALLMADGEQSLLTARRK